ncbi:twin-arginine translocase subunit TatC [archaeon SCG-AAA382B04]|nr:twin-arginine translocase subunit TatC [archaeon SCG-AAA382B04]
MPQPKKDHERPLMEHVLELRKRLLIVFAGVVAISIASFPLSVYLIDPVIASVIDPSNVMVYDPLHTFTVPINFSLIMGIALGLPLILYEAYQFMAPGLFRNEERLFAVITPASILLFTLGASIAYFLIIPNITGLVLGVGRGMSEANLYLKNILNFVLKMIAGFGILFQIPLILLFAIRIDFFSPTFLEERKLYFYIGFFVISNLFSPDPTMLSQVLVTVIFIVLYEMSYRLGYYVTPRTEADIEQFVDKFTHLGPLFSSIGVIIGLALSFGIPIWWLSLSTLFGIALYSSQRFSVSLIEEEGFGTFALFAPLLSPLIVSISLSKYYSVKIDLIYVITLFLVTITLTFVLEKLNRKVDDYTNKLGKKDEN